ncbi:MAG: ATP-binding cassette domain-containing protein [Desulfuromonadales bacterium]
MPPLYLLRGIEKRYNGQLVLELPHLELLPGRIYSLAGPNGAGKSTLLQILALLLPPTRGEMVFSGERVVWNGRSLARQRSAVTLVHQSPFLFDRPVYQNVAFGLKVRGVRGVEQHRRVASALAAVGLEGFAERRARELSGGEAQRVAMARALVLEPRVLLLDEPTANIDRAHIASIEKLVASLPNRGTLVVIATHDPGQAVRLGSEQLRMENGRLA